MFLGNTFWKKHAFVSSFVLEFLSGDSLELEHPLYRLDFKPFSYSPHPMGLHSEYACTSTHTCMHRPINPRWGARSAWVCAAGPQSQYSHHTGAMKPQWGQTQEVWTHPSPYLPVNVFPWSFLLIFFPWLFSPWAVRSQWGENGRMRDTWVAEIGVVSNKNDL